MLLHSFEGDGAMLTITFHGGKNSENEGESEEPIVGTILIRSDECLYQRATEGKEAVHGHEKDVQHCFFHGKLVAPAIQQTSSPTRPE